MVSPGSGSLEAEASKDTVTGAQPEAGCRVSSAWGAAFCRQDAFPTSVYAPSGETSLAAVEVTGAVAARAKNVLACREERVCPAVTKSTRLVETTMRRVPVAGS